MTPDDRKYTKSHEWAKLEGDELVVGITDHAQDALGDITFVELPEVGTSVQQNEEVAVVESVKAASDIYAPVSGEVAEVNGALEEKPEAINEDAYGEGWLFKLKHVDVAQVEALLSPADYESTLEE